MADLPAAPSALGARLDLQERTTQDRRRAWRCSYGTRANRQPEATLLNVLPCPPVCQLTRYI